MTTIKYILGTWLNGSQNYEQGVDILQRLTTDARRVAYFRKFQSEMSKTSLYNEIENLYNDQKDPALAPQDKSIETLEANLDMVDEWVKGEQGYYEGTRILEKLGADPGVVAFFTDRISGIGTSLLQKEMLKIHQELTRLHKEEIQRNAPPITIKDVVSYWLDNSDQDYTQGVNLLSVLSQDKEQISFFQAAYTPFRQLRLTQELEKLYKGLIAAPSTKAATDDESPAGRPKNPELEVAAAHKAVQSYKEMMNDRAALSNLTKVEGVEDVNSPDLLEQRQLPDSEEEEDLQEENVPDLKVKQTIDNLRKALSKLRGKEQTPERVALAQRHEVRLQALLPRWESLKQAT